MGGKENLGLWTKKTQTIFFKIKKVQSADMLHISAAKHAIY